MILKDTLSTLYIYIELKKKPYKSQRNIIDVLTVPVNQTWSNEVVISFCMFTKYPDGIIKANKTGKLRKNGSKLALTQAQEDRTFYPTTYILYKNAYM